MKDIKPIEAKKRSKEIYSQRKVVPVSDLIHQRMRAYSEHSGRKMIHVQETVMNRFLNEVGF